jgi:hypothetical protein
MHASKKEEKQQRKIYRVDIELGKEENESDFDARRDD